MPKAGGVRGKLSEDDLALIEALKVQRGSFTLKEICAELDDIGDVEESVSLSLHSRRYLGGRARVGKARGEGECEGERKNGRGPSHFSSLSFSRLRIPPPPP